MPGVALDDELLAGLSVGAPIGLGIHLTWVNRDRAMQPTIIGFAAAVAGALKRRLRRGAPCRVLRIFGFAGLGRVGVHVR